MYGNFSTREDLGNFGANLDGRLVMSGIADWITVNDQQHRKAQLLQQVSIYVFFHVMLRYPPLPQGESAVSGDQPRSAWQGSNLVVHVDANE